MPWYKAGTVSVTQNSNAVLGAGTAFIANARVGDAFRGPDGGWYEVTNIASDTALSISPDYQGATNAAGVYALAPMQGYVKDSADALRALVNQYGAKLAALGTTGNYDVLPVNKGGTAATTVGAAPFVGKGIINTADGTTLASATTPSIATISSSGHDRDTPLTLSNASNNAASAVMSFLREGTYGLHFGLDTDNRLKLGGWSYGAVARAIYHEGNIVGTVSQSGGVPTGAIIETGTNANGTYIKYADGSMECRGSTIGGIDQSTTSQAYSATIGFPAAFINAAYVVLVNISGVNVSNVFQGYCRASPSTPGAFSLIQYWNYVQTYSYTYIAKGRWF
ncbi:phage tail protein [Pseudomonas sp. GL-RE-29]|uniref:phage tail protein n=1 Tax=Pseudomonas sp. GL-RE-29 TaxID=2832375 RepID=UPI00398A37A3